MSTFGDSGVGSQLNTGYNQYMIATHAVCAASEDGVSFSIYLAGQVGFTVTLCVYADSGGLPGALLANSTISGVAVPVGPGWVTANFGGTAPSFVNGNTYWLTVLLNGGSQGFYLETGGSAPDATYYQFFGSGAPPSTYGGSPSLIQNNKMSAYITTAPAGPTRVDYAGNYWANVQ